MKSRLSLYNLVMGILGLIWFLSLLLVVFSEEVVYGHFGWLLIAVPIVIVIGLLPYKVWISIPGWRRIEGLIWRSKILTRSYTLLVGKEQSDKNWLEYHKKAKRTRGRY